MKDKKLTFGKLIFTPLVGIALCAGNHASAQLPIPEEGPKLELEVPAAGNKESQDEQDDSAVYDFIFDLMIELELEGVPEDLRVEMLEELAELLGVDFAMLAELAASLGFDLNEIDLAEELAGFGDDSNLFPDSSQAEDGNEDLGAIGLGGGILDPMNLPSALGGPPSGIPTTGFASSASVTKTLFGPNNEGVHIVKIYDNGEGNFIEDSIIINPDGTGETAHTVMESPEDYTRDISYSDGSSVEEGYFGNRRYEIRFGPNHTYRGSRWYRNGRLITTQRTPPSWFYNNPTQLPREDESSSALADWLFGRINVGKHTPAGAGANVPTHVNPVNGVVIKDAPSLFGGTIDPGSFVVNPDPNAAPNSSAAPNERVAEGLRNQIYPTNGGGLTPGPKPGTPEFGKELEAAAPKD